MGELEGAIGQTIVGTKVVGIDVAIITGLIVSIPKTVATGVGDAARQASILIAVVPVIASFAIVDDIVATTGFLTVQATGVGHIGCIQVAIITALFPPPQHTITTLGGLTQVGAGVALVSIAVITDFVGGLNDAITAGLLLAILSAAITIVLVTIIARLPTLPNKTIAADCDPTTRNAHIRVHRIAVITGLKTRLAGP